MCLRILGVHFIPLSIDINHRITQERLSKLYSGYDVRGDGQLVIDKLGNPKFVFQGKFEDLSLNKNIKSMIQLLVADNCKLVCNSILDALFDNWAATNFVVNVIATFSESEATIKVWASYRLSGCLIQGEVGSISRPVVINLNDPNSKNLDHYIFQSLKIAISGLFGRVTSSALDWFCLYCPYCGEYARIT